MNNIPIKSSLTTISIPPINISPTSSMMLDRSGIGGGGIGLGGGIGVGVGLVGGCENLFMKCRICVTDITDNSITIFNKDFLDEKIKKYLYVNIDFTDKYPKRLCKTCLVKLEEIHQFACFAQKNQQIFIRYVEYLKLQDTIGNSIPQQQHQHQHQQLQHHQQHLANQTITTTTSTTDNNNRINSTSNYLNTNTLFSNRDITIFSYDNLKLGHFIKDIDLLKLILKALKWQTNPKTLTEQLDKLRNANFRDILSNPDLLQDEDLTQLLGPYTNRGELNLMITRHNPQSTAAAAASSGRMINNFNNEVVCLIGDDDDDDDDVNKITEMEVGVDPDLFFPYDDDETRSAEEILQANNKLNELKPILCYECPQIFYSEAEIMEHNKLKHDTSVRLVPKKRKINKAVTLAPVVTTAVSSAPSAATASSTATATTTITTSMTTMTTISNTTKAVVINKNSTLNQRNNSTTKTIVSSLSSSLLSPVVRPPTPTTTTATIKTITSPKVVPTITSTTLTKTPRRIAPKITTPTPIKLPKIENIIPTSVLESNKPTSPLKTTPVAVSQNLTNIPKETVITKIPSTLPEILIPPIQTAMPILNSPSPPATPPPTIITPPPEKKQKTNPPTPPILKIPTPQILHATRKRKVNKTTPTNSKTSTSLNTTTAVATTTLTNAVVTRKSNTVTPTLPVPPPPPPPPPATTPPPSTTTPKSTNKKENTKILQRTRTPSKRLQSREKNHTPFLCTQCPKKLTTKGNLKVHIESHKLKPKFNCEKCDRVFKCNNNLIQHKKYHAGEKFICPTCDRVYPSNSTLRAHIVSHSNERPHSCNVCNKQFKRNQDLKFHMNQHTGDKPYKCPYCAKTFASSGNCFSHRKRMHSDKT